jgi:anti-sigma B factor antagonist
LLHKREGAPMVRMDLHTGECDGRAVVALRGELDVAEAASVAAGLAAVVIRERAVIVDLAGLEFIDSSGVAALVLVRAQARRTGGDLLLAAPQDQVMRLLTLTRLLDVFSVHASVEQAADCAGRSVLAVVPVR